MASHQCPGINIKVSPTCGMYCPPVPPRIPSTKHWDCTLIQKQHSSKFNVHMRHLEMLFKQILIQQVWSGTWDSASLTRCGNVVLLSWVPLGVAWGYTINVNKPPDTCTLLNPSQMQDWHYLPIPMGDSSSHANPESNISPIVKPLQDPNSLGMVAHSPWSIVETVSL